MKKFTKIMKKTIFVLTWLIIGYLIASCSPRQAIPQASDIQTAISETTTSNPANQRGQQITPTRDEIKPTNTFLPATQNCLCPTESPAQTPTPIEPMHSLISPDGRFIANVYEVYSDSKYYQTLEVTTSAGEPIASISQMQPRPLDPHATINLDRWSTDSSRLFFFDVFGLDWGGPHLWNGFNLRSLDVETGDILPLVLSDGVISFSFSPTQKYLVYAKREESPRHITVRDTHTSDERSISIPVPTIPENAETQIGGFEWAPDESGLVYYTSNNFNLELFYLPISSMRPEHLIGCDSELEECEFETWINNDTIRVRSVDGVQDINVKTGKSGVISTATSHP